MGWRWRGCDCPTGRARIAWRISAPAPWSGAIPCLRTAACPARGCAPSCWNAAAWTRSGWTRRTGGSSAGWPIPPADETGVTREFIGRVKPEWVDHYGHMNLAYYLVAFDMATDVLWPRIALGEGLRARGLGTFAV